MRNMTLESKPSLSTFAQHLRKLFTLLIVGFFLCGNGYNQAQSAQEFDNCIQDGSHLFQLNSVTGRYRFTECPLASPTGNSSSTSGVGRVTVRGTTTFLEDISTDRRVRASVDRSLNRGTASVNLLSSGFTVSIIDRNTASQTCECSTLTPPPPIAIKDCGPPGLIVPLYEFPVITSTVRCLDVLGLPSNCYEDKPKACFDIDPCDGFLPCNRGKVLPPRPCACAALKSFQDIAPGLRKLIALKKKYPSIEVIAVVNSDNSGPVPKGTPAEMEEKRKLLSIGICHLQNANIQVLGYVCTRGAFDRYTLCKNHSEDDVKNDIDYWRDQYNPWPDGIYFDEMANDPTKKDLYKGFCDYAKAADFTTTVGNPGAMPLDGLVDTALDPCRAGCAPVDKLIVWEDSMFPGTYSLKPPDQPKKRWGLLVHSQMLSSSTEVDAVLAHIDEAKNHVGYIYVTDEINSWNTIAGTISKRPQFLEELFIRLLTP